MNEQLQREERDLVSKRGLVPNTDDQVFEIYIPELLREQYDRVRGRERERREKER